MVACIGWIDQDKLIRNFMRHRKYFFTSANKDIGDERSQESCRGLFLVDEFWFKLKYW